MFLFDCVTLYHYCSTILVRTVFQPGRVNEQVGMNGITSVWPGGRSRDGERRPTAAAARKRRDVARRYRFVKGCCEGETGEGVEEERERGAGDNEGVCGGRVGGDEEIETISSSVGPLLIHYIPQAITQDTCFVSSTIVSSLRLYLSSLPPPSPFPPPLSIPPFPA